MQRSMFNASNGLQTPARSRAINSRLQVPANPAHRGWTDEDRPPGGPMFALKPGTKRCFLPHFLTSLRVFATRSIHDFPGAKISFRVLIQADLVAHSPLACPPKPRRRRVAHLPTACAFNTGKAASSRRTPKHAPPQAARQLRTSILFRPFTHPSSLITHHCTYPLRALRVSALSPYSVVRCRLLAVNGRPSPYYCSLRAVAVSSPEPSAGGTSHEL